MSAHHEDTNTNLVLSGATLAVAAFPVLAFALQVIARRSAELAGLAVSPGLLLVVACVGIAALLGQATDREHRVEAILTVVGLILSSVAFSVFFAKFPDPSWDAQTYHFPSVIRIAAGWRPQIEPSDLVLSNSYPTAGWTILAGFAELFGLESGRSINALLMISSSIMLWAALRRSQCSNLLSTVGAIVIAANPVAISQFPTALADGLVWYLTVIFVTSLLIMLDDRRVIMTLVAASALLLLINVKTSGLYFAAIVIVAVSFLIIVRSDRHVLSYVTQRRVQIAFIAFVFLFSIGLVGWRPYVTNLEEHHAILFPSPDQLGYKPGVGDQVPPDLQHEGRSKKLAALFLAQTDVRGAHVIWKFPWFVSRGELSMDSVTRVGGFGPLFAASCMLAILTFLTAATISMALRLRISYRSIEAPASIILIALASTCLFPEPWWARFVPMAWIIPSMIPILAAALIRGTKRCNRLVHQGVAATFLLCAVNSLLVGILSFKDALFWSRDIKTKIEQLSLEPSPIHLSEGTIWNPLIHARHAGEDVWRERLKNAGRGDVTVVDRNQCKKSKALSVDVMQCQN